MKQTFFRIRNFKNAIHRDLWSTQLFFQEYKTVNKGLVFELHGVLKSNLITLGNIFEMDTEFILFGRAQTMGSTQISHCPFHMLF